MARIETEKRVFLTISKKVAKEIAELWQDIKFYNLTDSVDEIFNAIENKEIDEIGIYDGTLLIDYVDDAEDE